MALFPLLIVSAGVLAYYLARTPNLMYMTQTTTILKSMGLTNKRQSILLCLIFQYFFTYQITVLFQVVGRFISSGGALDNSEPRVQKEQMRGIAARLQGVHTNALELFPAFVLGVLLCFHEKTALTPVNQIAVTVQSSFFLQMSCFATLIFSKFILQNVGEFLPFLFFKILSLLVNSYLFFFLKILSCFCEFLPFLFFFHQLFFSKFILAFQIGL